MNNLSKRPKIANKLTLYAKDHLEDKSKCHEFLNTNSAPSNTYHNNKKIPNVYDQNSGHRRDPLAPMKDLESTVMVLEKQS